MPRYQPADSSLSPRFVGVPTFARLPLVDTLEDVDVAVVGVPFDTGVTFRVGGRWGPNAVRAASLLLRPYNPVLDVKPFEHLSCIDGGDISIVPGFTERSYQAIEHHVRPLAETGVVPLLLGGDGIVLSPSIVSPGWLAEGRMTASDQAGPLPAATSRSTPASRDNNPAYVLDTQVAPALQLPITR